MSTNNTSLLDNCGGEFASPQFQVTWRYRIFLSFTAGVCRFVLFSVATTVALVLWAASGLISVGVCGEKSVT
jgi:hypothetical protein